MRIKKSSGSITLVCSLLILGWLLLRQNFSWTNFSNLLFLAALFFLIIGGFLWVFASGFFDHFQSSMKKAFRKQESDYLKLSEVGRQSYAFWLLPGACLLLLSLICLIFTIF